MTAAVFANAVEKWHARVPFKMQSRVDLMKEETVRALRRSGCVEVWMGVESGSQKILDAMEKGTTVAQIVSAREKLKEHGIRASYFLQFGYPGETRDDIEQTLQMVRACRPDDIGVSVSYPLPGTPFYERVKTQLGEKRNWLDSDDLAMMYSATYDPAFYRGLYALVHAEFRLRQSARRVAQAAVRPWTLRSRHLRELAAMAYRAAAIPFLRWTLARAARPAAPTLLTPLASPQAAAVPTDQASLE